MSDNDEKVDPVELLRREPEEAQPWVRRDAILLIDGMLAGKVFQIPPHRMGRDGQPREYYWLPVEATVRDKRTGAEETRHYAVKYLWMPDGTGYRQAEVHEITESTPLPR